MVYKKLGKKLELQFVFLKKKKIIYTIYFVMSQNWVS